MSSVCALARVCAVCVPHACVLAVVFSRVADRTTRLAAPIAGGLRLDGAVFRIRVTEMFIEDVMPIGLYAYANSPFWQVSTSCEGT